MEFMGTWDASLFEVILLVNTLKSHLGSSIEVPEGSVKIEKNMLVLSICVYGIWSNFAEAQAVPAYAFKRKSETADTSEKIYKTEICHTYFNASLS